MALNLYDNFPSKIPHHNGTNTNNKKNKNNESNLPRFRYLVVLDFEATCAKNRKINPQEIIEWPAIIIDTQTNELLLDKIFHFYIKPKHHPKLTSFCRQLTGITQELINTIGSKNTIESVTKEWNKWCLNNNLLPSSKDKLNACIITCGDWDLKKCWNEQKKISYCNIAALFHSWINIKIIFKRYTYNHYYHKYERKNGLSMMAMLQHLNIKHTGRHHSGIDDVKNICKIVQRLVRMGAKFDYTTKDFGKRSILNDIIILKQYQLERKKDIIDLSKDNHNTNTNNSNSVQMEWSPQPPSPSPPPSKFFHKPMHKKIKIHNEQKID